MNAFSANSRRTPSLRRGLGIAAAVWLFAALFALASCAKHDPMSDGDEVTRAEYLINQGDDSEAIYILAEHVKTVPGDMRARVLYASAYAHRGGIRLSSYIDFATDLSKWDAEKDSGLLGSSDPVIQNLSKALWQIQVVISAFGAIPSAGTQSAYDDLKQAVQVLDDGGRIYGGPSMYRALLRLAVFKYDLINKYKLQNGLRCSAGRVELVSWLQEIEADLETIITDVAYGLADSASRATMIRIAGELHDNIGVAVGYLNQGDGAIPIPQIPGSPVQCN